MQTVVHVEVTRQIAQHDMRGHLQIFITPNNMIGESCMKGNRGSGR